ncbi:MAG: RecQ family ATP-dependent DNA helicase [Sulfurifustaceae bacterium]
MLTQHSTTIDWPRLVRQAKRRFGVTEFRPGQRELITAVMTGRDALGIMPTGAGKSLAYQLPALFLPHATVVVSPLIALMQDQREKSEDARVAAVRIDSTLTTRESREAADEIAEGEARIIFVTPERLENPDYVDLLNTGGVSLLVIDEAHCISQWGHDFRPAYLSLRDAVRRLGRPPVLALTATATPAVAADIVRELAIKDALVVNTGANRENLIFEVRRTPTETLKRETLLRTLHEIDGPAIVYVATVRAADDLCPWLVERGVAAVRYHGELKPAERHEAQQGFMDNRYRAVVATKAFGLGIDKPDIRLVVHYHFPDSPETYYQEAGRGGRDGRPAHAVLLYRLEDRRIQTYFLGGKFPRREESKRVYDAVNAAAADGRGTTLRDLVVRTGLSERRVKVIVAQLERAEILERRARRLCQRRTFRDAVELEGFLNEYENRYAAERQRLESMMRYAQSTLCRMRYLRNYLGDVTDEDCGHCDNCRSRASRARRPRRARTPAERAVRKAIKFIKGQRVQHTRFGEGEVLEGGGDRFTVDFPRVGVKRVLASYLKAATRN